MSAKKLVVDKRLLGTWRSDRKRTIEEWRDHRSFSPKKKKVLASILGHLVLRYTRTRLYSDFQGRKEVRQYKVLGMDSDSVAITYWDSLIEWDVPYEEWRIDHIHFEDNRYWISTGDRREWFKRVKV